MLSILLNLFVMVMCIITIVLIIKARIHMKNLKKDLNSLFEVITKSCDNTIKELDKID
jgi:tellurite resistance protein TehA-like permease